MSQTYTGKPARQMERRVLLDARDPYDASLMGFDGRTDTCDGGIIVKLQEHPGVGPCITINGRDGEIEILGAEAIRIIGETLLGAVKIAAQAKARTAA